MGLPLTRFMLEYAGHRNEGARYDLGFGHPTESAGIAGVRRTQGWVSDLRPA
jgi:hypothetical protein